MKKTVYTECEEPNAFCTSYGVIQPHCRRLGLKAFFPATYKHGIRVNTMTFIDIKGQQEWIY